ncbi:hypothetical protein ABW19_dt0201422 [Dactylella cylindrospora]|nr:hypothetical protein ABW19_dt0201422 [Dactylella cylindrospora]
MKTVAPANVPMRRSCHFCRMRKIKCSGHNKCSACKERGIDCVFEAEASKGRPRTGSRRPSSKIKSGSSTPQLGGLNLSEAGLVGCFPPDLANDNLSVELTATFEEFFGKRSSYSARNGSPRSSGHVDPAVQDVFLHGSENASSASLSMPNIDSEKILETINYEVIETVCNNVSNLGCEPLARHRSRIISKSIPFDRSSRMFDPPPRYPVEDPLIDHEPHTFLQMIDVWLSTHPLSCIISKTLLLRSIKNKEHDRALLCIILSDSFGFSITKSSQDEEKFFSWAVGCLQAISYSTATISTAQTLILLGWHELRQNRPRPAICYFSVASRVVRNLWDGITEGEGPCTSQINGVSEGEVEMELITNMHWVISAVRLWMLLQIDPSLIDLEDTKTFTTLPISNEADSKLVELDVASDNVSTLNAQARSLRSLLSLSVTTLTASRLLLIFDQHERFYPAAHGDYGWTSPSAPQPADRRMLMESFTAQARVAIENICKASYGASSQSPMLRAESDLMFSIFEFAIFFPHSGEQSPEERPMDKKKAEDLLALIRLILQQPLLAPHFTGQEIPQFGNAEIPTELIVLTLDVSARVLQHLVHFYNGDRGELSPHPAKHEELVRISTMMLDLLRSDRLPFSGSRIRPTKRLLKRVKVILEYHQNSSGSLQAMDYSSIGTSSRSSNSSSSPWPATTQSYSHGLQIPPGLDSYSLSTASENGYLRHHGGPSDPMQYDLSPHAASHHGIPVTSATPEIQLPTEYTYSLDEHMSGTYPDEHYKMGMATASPDNDRRRARQYRNLSRHLVFDMESQFHY